MENWLDDNKDTPYLLRVEIENLKCFKKTTLNLFQDVFPSQWTVILGDNGTGKSTLLEAIYCLSPNFTKTESWLHSNEQDDFYNLIGFLHFDKTGFDYKLEALYYIYSKLAFISEIWLENSSGSHVSPYYFKNTFIWNYGATRKTLLSRNIEVNNDPYKSTLLDENAFLLDPEAWFIDNNLARNNKGNKDFVKSKKYEYETIKKLLIQLLPDIEDLEFTIPNEDNPTPKLKAKTPYGWVGIHDLSMGYKTTMAWLVDLAVRMFGKYKKHEKYKDEPLAGPAIVLVDEIDLHMHPKWQRTIMDHLSGIFKRTQFIVTAHSPLIVQSATDANVVVLKKVPDEENEGQYHVIIDNKPESVKGWRIDQILTSDLYGLESSRDKETEQLIIEKSEILGKSKLSKKDEKRLDEINAIIEGLPFGTSKETIEAEQLLVQQAKKVKA